MIKPDAHLTIQKIPLECLQVKQHEHRYPEKLMTYIKLLQDYPDEYAGLLHVEPSTTHPGMYTILEGHHRYAASIITGRTDVLAVIVEDAT